MWKSTIPFAGMMLEFLVTLRQGIFMEMIAQGQEVFLYRGIMQVKIMGSAGTILGKGSRTGWNEGVAFKCPLFNWAAGFELSSKFNHAFINKFGQFGRVMRGVWIDLKILDFL